MSELLLVSQAFSSQTSHFSPFSSSPLIQQNRSNTHTHASPSPHNQQQQPSTDSTSYHSQRSVVLLRRIWASQVLSISVCAACLFRSPVHPVVPLRTEYPRSQWQMKDPFVFSQFPFRQMLGFSSHSSTSKWSGKKR